MADIESPAPEAEPRDAAAAENPFPGSRPYGEGDRLRFFGRQTAIDALSSQILVERCVTLHGPSGCGKSSLFAAGVLPLLERERDVRAVVVKGWPDGLSPLEGFLQEMSETLRVARTTPEGNLPFDGARARVERVLKWAMQRSPRPILIYLDQVEQLIYPWRQDPAATDALFEAIEAIADQPVLGLSLVIALREDFLGLLRARLRHRPRLLDPGFRLSRLTIGEMTDAACAAAAKGEPPQRWTRDEVAAMLLDFPAPGQPAAEDSEIEAVYAQIVCRAQWDLWASTATGGERPRVSAKDTLRNYVDGTLRALGPSEAAARVFLESELIDGNGSRKLLTADEAGEALASHGLTEEASDRLIEHIERASILRHHEHHGAVYFELGHDLLAAHLNAQRKKREAEEEHLRREAVARQEADARQREVERRLASTLEEAKKERERAAERRARLVGWVGVLVVVAVATAAVAFWVSRERDRSRERAKVSGVLVQQSLGGDPATAVQVLLTLDPAAEGYLDLAHFTVNDPPPRVTLRGHEDKVIGAAWSPDGRRIVSFSKDATARVWPADGHGDPVVLRGHDEGILGAEFSRDGSKIVTASSDRTAIVWDAKTGEALQRLSHERAVLAARFSPDGEHLATASADATVALWTLGKPDPPVMLIGHMGPVRDIAWSPDGQLLASGSDDGALMVWPASGDSAPRVLCCHPIGLDKDTSTLNPEAGITHVAWSPDGQRLLSASQFTAASVGKTLLRVWNLDAGGGTIDLGVNQLTYTARFSPDGKSLAAAHADRAVRVWSLDQPERPPVELRGHLAEIRDLSWSPDGQYLATASNDRTARVFRANGSGAPLLLRGHRSRVNTVAFSPGGEALLTTSNDGTTRVWSGIEWNSAVRVPGPVSGRRHSADVSPDGRRAAIATDAAPLVYVLGLDGAAAPLYLKTSALASTVRWSRNGERLATTANTAPWTATLWRLDRAKPVAATGGFPAGTLLRNGDPGATVVLTGHTKPVYAVDFEPGDLRIATASLDGTARLWDTATGALLATFEHDRASLGLPLRCTLLGVAWSPDGSRIVTTCEQRIAVVWEVNRPEAPIAILRGHTEGVEWAAWSPDGKQIVTASYDQTVRVWNADGSGTALVLPHDSGVLSAVFNRDQDKLLSVSSDDRSAYVWDLPGMRSVGSLAEPQRLRHENAISAASFTPDGRSALVASDRSVRLWHLDPVALRAQLAQLNEDCLDPVARETHLGESKATAERSHDACERGHGRTPRAALDP